MAPVEPLQKDVGRRMRLNTFTKLILNTQGPTCENMCTASRTSVSRTLKSSSEGVVEAISGYHVCMAATEQEETTELSPPVVAENPAALL